mmetsp:Transcript_46287/g.100536  ORF Transcript_46287/g.100536 Transcript_46287/m.100536 type:complete len:177 (-) Transcript_46287:435-965(-)|eukprot:6188996-Pleurochrysis_carterae.AAC.1
MVFFLLPIRVAQLVAQKIKAENLKLKAGAVLEGGIKIVCISRVEVAHIHQWLGVPGPKNIIAAAKEAVFGKDKRIFVALEGPDGSSLLLLLKMSKNHPEELDEDLLIEKKDIDAGFAEGFGWSAPSIEATKITKRGEGLFRLAPRKALAVQRVEMYDMSVSEPEAIAWFEDKAKAP